ncbi:uncharacterized protein E0L32_006731 [Thyridium curvatum]|uniref:Protein kinase domain-containing protein n=1 Tax=Thyridium curvatum TaxID=1093900 RepID=A0A507B720_9PEZI|nr:uncharacterized protein E0L32_006731 [Thyridium curvatum]TPX12851.1 hypothetical protein E0L32_006731 [Thyridium curvatum]
MEAQAEEKEEASSAQSQPAMEAAVEEKKPASPREMVDRLFADMGPEDVTKYPFPKETYPTEPCTLQALPLEVLKHGHGPKLSENLEVGVIGTIANTQSVTLLVWFRTMTGHSTQGVLKLYDRRFGSSLRSLDYLGTFEHNTKAEEDFQSFVLRDQIKPFLQEVHQREEDEVDLDPDYRMHNWDWLGEDKGPDCYAKYEAMIWRTTRRYFDREVEAYEQLEPMQGRAIPVMYAHVRVAMPDTYDPVQVQMAPYNEVRGILLQWVGKYTLETIHKSKARRPRTTEQWQSLVQSAMDNALEINKRGIHIKSTLNARNVVISKATGQPFIIDFGRACSDREAREQMRLLQQTDNCIPGKSSTMIDNNTSDAEHEAQKEKTAEEGKAVDEKQWDVPDTWDDLVAEKDPEVKWWKTVLYYGDPNSLAEEVSGDFKHNGGVEPKFKPLNLDAFIIELMKEKAQRGGWHWIGSDSLVWDLTDSPVQQAEPASPCEMVRRFEADIDWKDYTPIPYGENRPLRVEILKDCHDPPLVKLHRFNILRVLDMTLSCAMHVTFVTEKGDRMVAVLKLYDRRFGTELRDILRVSDVPYRHTTEAEEAFQDFVLADKVDPFFCELDKRQEASLLETSAREILYENEGPDQFAKYEAMVWRECQKYFDVETDIYDRLKPLQGKSIPQMYAHVRLELPDTYDPVQTQLAPYKEVRGILIQYINGFNLTDLYTSRRAPRQLDEWRTIPRNVIVDGKTNQPFFIDFAFCSTDDEMKEEMRQLRESGSRPSDEEEDSSKEEQDSHNDFHCPEERDPELQWWVSLGPFENSNAIGCIMKGKLRTTRQLNLGLKFPDGKKFMSELRERKAQLDEWKWFGFP